VLRIDAGIAQPVTLSLESNGRFKLEGDVKAELFGDAATLTGNIEASETHAFIDGTFWCQVGALKLSLIGRTRVGPGAHFEVGGTGKLLLDETQLALVSGRVTESGASVEGLLELSQWHTPLGDIPCALKLQLRGSVDVHERKSPSFSLEGAGELTFLEARVQGRGGLGRTEHGEHYVFVEGRLAWQGREWMKGRVELRDRGVLISGRTSLAFDLTPPNIGNVEVANLFFMLDIDGTFTLDANGGLTAHSELGLAWQLAMQFPGDKLKRQSFPIAMQHQTVAATTFKAGERLRQLLLEVQTPRLLPQSITLPSVRVHVTEKPLRVHKHSLSFGDIPILKDIPPLHVYLPEIPGIHDEGNDLPLAGNEGWRELIKVPTHISAELNAQNISLTAPTHFSLHLAWDSAKQRFSIELDKP
jgi:hypothetical protein